MTEDMKISVAGMKLAKSEKNDGSPNPVKAYAGLHLGTEETPEMWGIHGIKVVEGKNGLFVAMPGYKNGDNFQDQVHPLTKEGRDIVNNLVLDAFKKMRK